MSIDDLMRLARAVTDPFALLFLGGSVLLLWGLWRVLRDDLDLEDEEGTSEEEDDHRTGGRGAPTGRWAHGGVRR